MPEHPLNVSTYAERVLFSDRLEKKLDLSDFDRVVVGPGDSSRAKPLVGAPDPGRPPSLRMARRARGKADRSPLPSTPRLVDEENRGRLLHFFANHELLAAELMALALLKFPDAPAEFRRGLLGTLREEQIHTRWYLKRMRECGVEFGDHPVSGYFWDAVSGMESPLDYVSRLSLTFEQANLDYSRHYAEVLREAGDGASARILEKIHRDEIQHVGYGLHWLHHWKDPDESVWNALERRLAFPLSPSRAKGNGTAFNREGRLAAGLDLEYVDRLAIFERSKGRVPDLWFFNADAEMRIAAWPGAYHPKRFARSLVADLETLSLFLAKRDDILVMRQHPGVAFLARLRDCGFPLPEIEVLDRAGRIPADSLLRQRRLGKLAPWSHSPELAGIFAELAEPAPSPEPAADAPSADTSTDSPHPGQTLPPSRPDWSRPLRWDDALAACFSKYRQCEELAPWFGDSQLCRTREEIAGAAAAFRAERWEKVLLKPEFTAAGRGARQLDPGQADPDTAGDRLPETWAALPLPCLLEAHHQRVFDFSTQYETTGEGDLRLLGTVHQIVDERGRYRGSRRPFKLCRGLGPELTRFLMEEALPAHQPGSEFCDALLAWTRRHRYRGPLGVDSYVHRDASGRLRHRVLCEINPRFTMGRVLLELRKQVAPGQDATLEIVRAGDHAPEERESEAAPVILDSGGKIESGTLWLTPRRPDEQFAARLVVGMGPDRT